MTNYSLVLVRDFSVNLNLRAALYKLNRRARINSLLRKRSYGFVTQSFLPHERLLQPVATSVRANWPITGRLPIFVKQDFDLKFISRIHVNMANVAAVFDLVAQKFCIRELNALQKEAIIQFVEKQRDVFLQKEVDRPTRLLQVVAFVHLPFSFRCLDLLCSFTLV